MEKGMNTATWQKISNKNFWLICKWKQIYSAHWGLLDKENVLLSVKYPPPRALLASVCAIYATQTNLLRRCLMAPLPLAMDSKKKNPITKNLT